ncbi:hypothetical protein HPP92_012597 [Vanilla planifolia]|uniref:Uncharacterized protein n=1 Tax=Vanilla planifolia TaxID=51239 RepID=A0A835UXY4_VANPL|nr:hypothetical protein HPP92_012597 [Vanilla planifolia]
MASSSDLLYRFLPLLLPFLDPRHLAGVHADAIVRGTVFCDQCKDGSPTFLDYPLQGARVRVSCVDQYTDEGTDLFGMYTLQFEGSPDLSGCVARVLDGPPECGVAAGPTQRLRLVFRMFDMAAYAVDPLLAQPKQPKDFCAPAPPKPGSSRPPLLPPPPQAPAARSPPFLEASACSYDKWLMPEFRCHWRVVQPETLVGVAFGPLAYARYGPGATLWNGLHDRGEVYGTLLREATAALLNSYENFRFAFPTLSVLSEMNYALLGTRRDALMVALRFRRANYGMSGGCAPVGCKFAPCS